MPQVTDGALTAQANIIGSETTPEANTADRVRDMLINLIDSKANNTSVPVSQFRGAHDASGNLYPAAGGGSGAAGAIQAGDEWYVSVSGQITARTGSMIVEVGTILKALTNVPGQTVTNWAVIQVS
jgi:hypothetical protein